MKKLTGFGLLFTIVCFSNAQTHYDSLVREKEVYVETKMFQDELNQEYSTLATSPLESTDFEKFSSLNFFPSNVSAVVNASFTKYKKTKKFKMKTSTTRKPVYVKYAEVRFIYEGKTCSLTVYQNTELMKNPGYEDYLFLPFTDLTNGETTYGGGRYIDLRIPEGEMIVIDFNKAYNPYCAYSHKYSCPIPPPENFLDLKVEAGVKEGLLYK